MIQAIWSITQLVLLGGLILAGSSVSLQHVDVAFRYDGTLTIYLDPVFLVRADRELARRLAGREVNGFAFGDIAVVCSDLEGRYVDYVAEHEMVHVLQFRALGPCLFLAYSLNPWFFEPRLHISKSQISTLVNARPEDWQEVLNQLSLKSMWLPPENWPSTWHLISFHAY